MDSSINLDSINIDELLDDIISCFANDEDAKVLLSSIVLCETLKDNLLNTDLLKDYALKAFSNNNLNIDDVNNWYSFDLNKNPEKKELWKLMNSINILLGDKKFNEIESFDINLIIKNEQLYPQVDGKYNVISTKVDELLNSIIIEEVFATVVKEMFNDNGYLSEVFVVPTDVNWYRKDASKNEEYDLKLFIEAFVVVQEFFDFNIFEEIVGVFVICIPTRVPSTVNSQTKTGRIYFLSH